MTDKRRKLVAVILGALLGRGSILGLNPIGTGYFLSVYAQEAGLSYLAIWVLLGMATGSGGLIKAGEPVEYGILVKYGVSFLAIVVVLRLAEAMGKRLSKEMKYAIGGGIVAVVSLMGGMFTPQYKTYIVLAALEGILTFVFARLFQAGLGYLFYHRKKEAMCQEEMVSTGILLGAAVYCMPSFPFSAVSLPFSFSYVIVLVIGLVAGYFTHIRRNRMAEGDSYVRQNIQLLVKNKVQEFSDSLQRLSGSFSTMAREPKAVSYADVNEIFEDVSERFCKDCSRCMRCWGEEYETTYAATQQLFLEARSQGYVDVACIPDKFSHQCIHAGEFIEETNELLREMQANLGFENRLAESRAAVAGQLGEMARMMKGFATELYEMKEIRTRQEEEMLRRLKKSRIEVQKLIIMEQKENRQEVHLLARMKWGRCITAREIASILGQVMGKSLRPAKQTKSVLGKEPEVMVFIEDTPFKVLTGVARAMKEGEEVSGDNFSILSLDDGKEVLMLSDGMGSGERANEESRLVIELLEHFLEAGFDKEAAVRMINSTYVLQADSRSFSTIDLGSVDLYTGEVELLKLGGAASFVKRKEGVKCVCAETLPVGMFQGLELVTQKETLADGEYLLMVTDGILDCFEGENKEDYVAFLLEETKSVNPREIAAYVLEKAVEANGSRTQDDMTVLVAGVWEK